MAAHVTYSGKVVHGFKFGRKLGFPTANLDRRQWTREKLNLKYGVYAGTAELPSGKRYAAGIVVGPVDRLGLSKIEAHLLKFKGDLYGQTIKLVFTKFLRPYKKFKDLEGLQQQIGADMQRVSSLVTITK